jgi:hypothetical protein
VSQQKLPLRTAFRETILPPLRKAGFRDYSGDYGGTYVGVVRASCIKPYADRLMLAVQFIDNRANHHSLVCRAWLVPWDGADDALERLQIGLCLILFDDYEFSEEAAAGIVRRVVALDALVPSLRQSVLAEMADPPLPSYRAAVYLAERRVVDAVVAGRDAPAAAAWRAVLADLAKLTAKGFTGKAVNQRVRAFASAHGEALVRLGREADVPYLREAPSERDWEMFVGPFHVEAYYAEIVRRRPG